MTWKKLLLIGDSNTQYGYAKNGAWVSLLSEMLQRKCDVINRGFSGYNTQHIRAFLPKILDEFKVDLVCGIVIMLGTNDSAIETSIQHVPLENYVTNLEWIINYLINDFKLDKEKIIVVSPGKIDNSKWIEEEKKLNENSKLLDELVAVYANECVKFCGNNNLNCINFYEIMSSKGEDFKELFYDGLHFSEKGGQLLFGHLKPLVEKYFLKDLNDNYPDWKLLSSDPNVLSGLEI